MTKAAFSKTKILFTSQLDTNLTKKSSDIWDIALCGAENWTLRKIDQK